MAEEPTIECWACGSKVKANLENCSECSMPLSSAQGDIDDIDSFLDEASASPEDQPAIPEFNLPETEAGGTDPQVAGAFQPEIPSFDELDSEEISDQPDIPTFDDLDSDQTSDQPSIPDFSEMDASTEEVSVPEIGEEMEIPQFDDSMYTEGQEAPLATVEEPTIPELILDLPEEDPAEEPTSQLVDQDFYSLSLQARIGLFLPQTIYWTLIFFVISITSVQVIDQNVNLDDLTSSQYLLRPELFVFGWLSFIPMGWFFGYKLTQYQLERKALYGMVYLVGQFIVIVLANAILTIIVNGSTSMDPSNAVLNSYIQFTIYGFLFSLFTFGIVLFFFSYKIYWTRIFDVTPLSRN